MILSAFLLLCCAVATWTVSPAKRRESESPASEMGADHPAYGTLDQVTKMVCFVLSQLVLLCCKFRFYIHSVRNLIAFWSVPRRVDRSWQVKAALQRVGLESSNLIIGVDFTKSNEWTGAHSLSENFIQLAPFSSVMTYD